MNSADHPLLRRWSDGEPGLIAAQLLPSTLVAEMIQRSGPDGILFDMQHGEIDGQSLTNLFQVVGMLGGTPFVRVPSTDPWMIMKALDAGAFGIVCPLVNTRAEAQAVVDACYYPPVGSRSNGAVRRAVYGSTDDFHATANATVLPFVQIETEEAVANLDDIASVPGLAGLVIGPSDLGGSLGYGFLFDRREETLLDVYRDVVAAARAHGIHPGIFTAGPAYSREMVELGFDFVIMVGSDVSAIAAAAAAKVTGFREQSAPLR